jgi:hypothetical protein
MTDVGRMSVQELVGKVLADEHADVLRQAVVWLAQELMEVEAAAAAALAMGSAAASGPPAVTATGAGMGDPGRLDGAGHSQAAVGVVLPELPGAPAAAG